MHLEHPQQVRTAAANLGCLLFGDYSIIGCVNSINVLSCPSPFQKIATQCLGATNRAPCMQFSANIFSADWHKFSTGNCGEERGKEREGSKRQVKQSMLLCAMKQPSWRHWKIYFHVIFHFDLHEHCSFENKVKQNRLSTELGGRNQFSLLN